MKIQKRKSCFAIDCTDIFLKKPWLSLYRLPKSKEKTAASLEIKWIQKVA